MTAFTVGGPSGPENDGAKILISELDEKLKHTRSEEKSLILRCLRFLLEKSLTIEYIRKRSWGVWAYEHPNLAVALVVALILFQNLLSPVLIALGLPKEIALIISGGK